ncbi:MAG: cytochrome c [Chloracidobacterium sp.]|nr:cytochrome c [Chloracidobacterium sp.]MDW8218385.1 cytochrome c [Acidobacteriota bacterium]
MLSIRLTSKLAFAVLTALIIGGWAAESRPAASDDAAAKRLARGKRLYNGAGACVACHGVDGKPSVPDAPDLTDAAWQRKRTDNDFAKAIAEGKGTMPPFKGSAADIEALVAYVRSLAK